MVIKTEVVEELSLLAQFDLASLNAGIKVHSHDASAATVAAAARLFEKGLTDHKDGGYLTHRGIEAARHVQSLLHLLTSA